MATATRELTVELSPRSRVDAIDVTRHIQDRFGDVLREYRRVLYCSHHTTAGYLDQRLADRLSQRQLGPDPFIRRYQELFPHGAGYRHDDLHLRSELSESDRNLEPPNADAHLTFIGSGLQNCVTYINRPASPVFFMDLDGVYNGRHRNRISSVVGYNEERVRARFWTEVPVSGHAIDSVNLYDARLELKDRIDDLLSRHPVDTGRLDITLDPAESNAAVTVNEFETLLMRHDLADVLEDPLRFVARQGRRMLQAPLTVPAKSLGYARYDVVQVVNRLLDSLGPIGASLERIVSRLMAVPAARRLRLKRSLSLAVSSHDEGQPRVVRGRFQTPILIQWNATQRRSRTILVTLYGFE
jgi:thiamine phosphate synthase YjbQ (UPF0047 family)